MNKVILLLLAIGLSGCSQSVDIRLEPEVHIFFSDDANKKIRITQNDEAYMVLNEWLLRHNADWYPTYGNYPGGVYVESGDYGIQVTESKVIIYSIKSNELKATHIQENKKGELNAILNFKG